MREVSLAICDIAQNSIDAGAKHLRIAVAVDKSAISFEVNDDGRGMDSETLAEIARRGVSFKGSHGLGLATLKEETKTLGGNFEIKSQKGVGTKVCASFSRQSGAKLGDMGATAVTLIDENYDCVLILSVCGKEKCIDLGELRSASSVAELQSRGVLRLIREDINKFIRQNGGTNL